MPSGPRGFLILGMDYDLFAFAPTGSPAYYSCTRVDENTYELDLVAYRPPNGYDRVAEHIVLTKAKRWESDPPLDRAFFQQLVEKLNAWIKEH